MRSVVLFAIEYSILLIYVVRIYGNYTHFSQILTMMLVYWIISMSSFKVYIEIKKYGARCILYCYTRTVHIT